jgi:DNA-binding LacI/PurR family transcriptional regulator
MLAFLTIDPSTNFIAAPFTSQIVAGITAAAAATGYSLVVLAERGVGDEPNHLPVTFRRVLREQSIDGAIVALAGAPATRKALFRELVAAGRPFVLLQEALVSPLNAAVLADDRGAGEFVTRHLIKRGRRVIGFINENTAWPSLEARLNGYREALASHGIAFDQRLVVAASESAEGGYAAMNLLLDEHPDLTAVIGFNDLAALGALNACQQRALHVPDDIAVVGFDDFAFAGWINPPLTTVRMKGDEIGRKATELLAGYLATGEFPERQMIIPAEPVLRISA